MISCFRDDPRIVLWDLYNEPMNAAQVGTAEWLREIFFWARQAEPAQRGFEIHGTDGESRKE